MSQVLLSNSDLAAAEEEDVDGELTADGEEGGSEPWYQQVWQGVKLLKIFVFIITVKEYLEDSSEENETGEDNQAEDNKKKGMTDSEVPPLNARWVKHTAIQ